MTKEDFITGVEFEIKGNFFKLDEDQRSITKIFRSTDRSRIIMEDYHMNVDEINEFGFGAYTYILGEKVVREMEFSDLELFGL
jgi:hypothetical protein